MEITSNILGQAARALRGSAPGIQETSITLPDQLFPAISLSEPPVFSVTAANLETSSFIKNYQALVANAAQIADDLTFLGSGIWEIQMDVTYSSNYSTGPNNGLQISAQQSHEDKTTFGNTVLLSELFTQGANGGDLRSVRTWIVPVAEALYLAFILSANGAGKTHASTICLSGRKLL